MRKKNSARAALLDSLRTLTAEHKRNLRWHLKHGTPILCGTNARMYTDGRGGG